MGIDVQYNIQYTVYVYVCSFIALFDLCECCHLTSVPLVAAKEKGA